MLGQQMLLAAELPPHPQKFSQTKKNGQVPIILEKNKGDRLQKRQPGRPPPSHSLRARCHGLLYPIKSFQPNGNIICTFAIYRYGGEKGAGYGLSTSTLPGFLPKQFLGILL